MKQYLKIIKLPIAITILNVFPGNLLYSLLPGTLGMVVFNLFRFAIVFYAAWIISREKTSSLWLAALSGPLLLFIDHVVLKGGYFLFAQIVNPTSVDNKGGLAFVGVLTSYVMFAPLFLIVGYLGGWVSRRRQLSH